MQACTLHACSPVSDPKQSFPHAVITTYQLGKLSHGKCLNLLHHLDGKHLDYEAIQLHSITFLANSSPTAMSTVANSHECFEFIAQA